MLPRGLALTRYEDVGDALGLQHVCQRCALQLVPEGVAEAAARRETAQKQCSREASQAAVVT